MVSVPELSIVPTKLLIPIEPEVFEILIVPELVIVT